MGDNFTQENMNIKMVGPQNAAIRKSKNIVHLLTSKVQVAFNSTNAIFTNQFLSDIEIDLSKSVGSAR